MTFYLFDLKILFYEILFSRRLINILVAMHTEVGLLLAKDLE
jgi:hypothetical protein